MAKKQKRDHWKVTMRCEVTRIVSCEDCTEEEARENPWDYATDEQDVDLINWEVRKVERDV